MTRQQANIHRKKTYTVITAIFAAILLCVIGCAVYVNDYYHADETVVQAMAADGTAERFSDIDAWYIGGHSLGGAMAANYAIGHNGEFEGLILLAAYSTEYLSGSGLDVLSIYGSEDRVLSLEKYEANRDHLPADATEVVIEGGCHAGFGVYGPQNGMGTTVDEHSPEMAEIVRRICKNSDGHDSKQVQRFILDNRRRYEADSYLDHYLTEYEIVVRLISDMEEQIGLTEDPAVLRDLIRRHWVNARCSRTPAPFLSGVRSPSISSPTTA